MKVKEPFRHIVNLCQAINQASQLAICDFQFDLGEYFLQSLATDFVAFLKPLLRFPQQNAWRHIPSILEARVRDYLWCASQMANLMVASVNKIDFTLACSGLMDLIQGPLEAPGPLTEDIKRYLTDFFTAIISPVVHGNALIYSETHQAFVAPLEGNDSALCLVEACLSLSELSSLCRVMGVHGVNGLIRDMIYEQGIVQELRHVKEMLREEKGCNFSIDELWTSIFHNTYSYVQFSRCLFSRA